jgi:hypothetical protein
MTVTHSGDVPEVLPGPSPQRMGSDAPHKDDDQDDQQDRAKAAPDVWATNVESAPAEDHEQQD